MTSDRRAHVVAGHGPVRVTATPSTSPPRLQTRGRPGGRPYALRRPAAPVWRAALACGVVATVLAAAGTWIPSLWGDEVTTVMSAQRSLPSLLDMLGHVDAVYGLFYAGMHVWGGLVGFSAFAVRLPSALAVGAAAAGVVVLVDRWGSRRVAVMAGLVCAVLPRVTYMGTDARAYGFSAAIVTWLTVVAVVLWATPRPHRRWWVLYGALLALGIYTFLYIVLFIVVHGVILLLARAPRTTLRRWALACACAVVAASPVLAFGIREHGQIAYLDTDPQLAPNTLYATLWFGTATIATVCWALIVLGCVMAIRRAHAAQLVQTAQTVQTGRMVGRMPTLVTVAGAWLLVPTVLLIAAQLVIPAFTARYVSFCAPAAAILVACGLDELFRRRVWAGLVVGVALVALIAPVYVAQRTPYAQDDSDFAEVSAAIGAYARPGDAVVFDDGTNPYRRPRLAEHAYPAGFAHTRDVTLKTPFTRTVDTWHDATYTVAEAAARGRFDGVRRVWVIEYAPASGPADTYGVASLEHLGFAPAHVRVHTYRGLIVLYTRVAGR